MNVLRFTLICVLIASAAALQCRTNKPSDEDLKRITRSCMRKIGESINRSQQNQSRSFYSAYNERDYDEYNRDEDRFRSESRDRFQGRSGRSASQSRNQQQNQRRKDNGSGTGSNNNNNNNNSTRSDRQSRDMQQDGHNGACVVHCFFEEMNMLNNDDYPDKHKVIHILTRDIRERELRTFYTDSIQECFSYLEMRRRKDKCQFSKELITCMTQYARANCDDWDDRTLIFT